MARAFSYVRFSTPEQKLGGSLARQIDAAQKYAADHNLTLDETMKDEGLSGFHGRHVQKDGALGGFLEKVKDGDIEKGSVLIVEHLDRLSRQEPGVAQEQLLGIINRGVDVVTLADSVRYTKGNTTQLFLSLGIMIGNHSQSAVKSDRIKDHHKAARGTVKAMVPAWISKEVVRDGRRIVSGQLVIDEEKAKMVRRIFKMAEEMGADSIAKRLNEQHIPVLTDKKKCDRPERLWNNSSIRSLIRGKQPLGLQEIGYYEGRRRKVTGEYVQAAYPAIISEDQWNRSNAALDGRKSGVNNGRNVTNYSNLFGEIARCECGNRMKIRHSNSKAYIQCSGASLGACKNKKFHRLDTLERHLHTLFVNVRRKVESEDDQGATLAAEVGTAKAEVDRLAKRYSRLFEQFGDSDDELALANLKRVSDDHRAAKDRLTKLERQLAAQTTKPQTDLGEFVRFLRGLAGLSGDELRECRRRIAGELPSIVRKIVFSDGEAPRFEFQPGYGLLHGWTGSGQQIVSLDDLPRSPLVIG